jgi:hypothetical protein
MIDSLGQVTGRVYEARGYLKIPQTAVYWMGLIPSARQSSLDLRSKMRSVAGLFLGAGIVNAGCDFILQKSRVIAGATLLKRGFSLTYWCHEQKYFSLQEPVAFRFKVAGTGLGLALHTHRFVQEWSLKNGIRVAISFLNLINYFCESMRLSIALLALKTSFIALSWLAP